MTAAVEIYDTTLRDGSQRAGISYSVADKLRIARALDALGVTFVEAGWPGSNPKDAELFSIISSFDATYSAYNGYQAGMERFWTLKYLEQNGITELEATVFKEGPGGSFLVRADALPLVFPVLGAQNLPRGARLRVKLGEVDEITLDLHGTVLERLDDPLDPSDDGPVDDEGSDDSDDAVAGPIAIAVDMNEPEAAPADAAAP